MADTITANISSYPTAITASLSTYMTSISTNFVETTLEFLDGAGLNIENTFSQDNHFLQDVSIDGDLTGVDSITFDTAAVEANAVGKLKWNDEDGTLDLGLKGGNVTLQVGQEMVVRAVNKTNTNLLEANYQVARIRTEAEGGSQGQRLAIILAQANNDNNSVDTLGLVTENIDNNQEGFVTTFGLVRGINTTGSLQGEDWGDGDVLYLSPTIAGRLTKVKPEAPQHTVIVGFVVYSHQNNGKIFVKVDNGYEINELHNVKINGVTNNSLLTYDSGLSVWKNTNSVNVSTLSATSLSANSATITGLTQLNTTTIGSSPAYDQTRLLKVYDDGNSGGARVSVIGTSTVANTPAIEFVMDGDINQRSMIRMMNESSASKGLDFVTSNNGNVGVRGVMTGNGNVGIGTTTPTQKLDVVGDIGVSNGLIMTGVPTSQSDVNYIRGLNSSTTVGFLAGTGVLNAVDGPFFAARGNTYSAISNQRGMVFIAAGAVNIPTGLEGSLRFTTGSNADRMIVDRTGNVGIGTTSPTSKLHIVDDWGTVKTSNSISSSFTLFPNSGNTTAFTIFRRGDTSNRAFTIGINATNGTEIGTNNASISFNTSTLHLAAGVGGNVGIGTTTPTYKLQLSGVSTLGFDTTASEPAIVGNASGISLKVSGGGTNIFRGLDGWTLTWSDALATTYFQVGRGGGNTMFSSAGGQPFKRLSFSVANTTNNGVVFTTQTSSLSAPIGYFEIRQGSTPNFLVQKTTGNIGIGTTTPNEALTVVGNISATGVDNRLPNQQFTTYDDILTRQYIDNRDQYASNINRITSDNVYQMGVYEFFDDFTEIGGASYQSKTYVQAVTGSGGTLNHANDDSSVADIMINNPSGDDRYTYRGLAQLQSSGVYNSAVCYVAATSLGQGLGNYYCANAAWRVYIAQNDPTTYIRFGVTLPMGGQFTTSSMLNHRSLCFDGNISPNFFFGAPTGRTYNVSTSADTGIPCLTGVWCNIHMDYIPHPTIYNNLSVIDLTVNYPKNNLKYTYRFTPTSDFGMGAAQWWKKNATGIIIGQQETRGGNLPRKSMYIDWVYMKTQPLTASNHPDNWNSIRFTK